MGTVLLNKEFAAFLRPFFYISCPVVCSSSQQVFKRLKQQYGIQTLINHKRFLVKLCIVSIKCSRCVIYFYLAVLLL